MKWLREILTFRTPLNAARTNRRRGSICGDLPTRLFVNRGDPVYTCMSRNSSGYKITDNRQHAHNADEVDSESACAV